MDTQEFFICNGIVVGSDGLQAADVRVSGEKIAELIRRQTKATNADVPLGKNKIDAAGLWVLPGGVDAHLHFGMPLREKIASLGWRESSEAALLGGTTTVIDFANPEPGEHIKAAVDRWRAAADPACLCDYGLHATVSEVSAERLAELPSLVASGIPSFKAFLAYKDRFMLTPDELEQLMKAVVACDGHLLVHAEDGALNASAEATLVATGRISPEWHPKAHPPESELKAVQTTLSLAQQTGCPTTIVHLSLAESVGLLRRARRNLTTADSSKLIRGEVCLHHMFASSGHCQGSFESFLRAVVSPPIREVTDSMELLAGLERGDLDLLSTDHCEFPLATKSRAAQRGFPNIPSGTGGVGERLTIAYTKGVRTDQLSVERWIQTCCEAPATLMGLAGRKGKIAPGYDADLVLFDPEMEYRWQPLGRSDPASSLYAGHHVVGSVRSVWRRGSLMVADGRLREDLEPGQFLRRS